MSPMGQEDLRIFLFARPIFITSFQNAICTPELTNNFIKEIPSWDQDSWRWALSFVICRNVLCM